MGEQACNHRKANENDIPKAIDHALSAAEDRWVIPELSRQNNAPAQTLTCRNVP
jgi:hypothetical protein